MERTRLRTLAPERVDSNPDGADFEIMRFIMTTITFGRSILFVSWVLGIL